MSGPRASRIASRRWTTGVSTTHRRQGVIGDEAAEVGFGGEDGEGPASEAAVGVDRLYPVVHVGPLGFVYFFGFTFYFKYKDLARTEADQEVGEVAAHHASVDV